MLMTETNIDTADDDELAVSSGDDYFTTSSTEEYFPVLRYDADYVPVGESSTFCLHLKWIKRDMKNVYDMYKTVKGFPSCVNAQNRLFY